MEEFLLSLPAPAGVLPAAPAAAIPAELAALSPERRALLLARLRHGRAAKP
jgi:hypothetical protein